jgi:hypothetical protein
MSSDISYILQLHREGRIDHIALNEALLNINKTSEGPALASQALENLQKRRRNKKLR